MADMNKLYAKFLKNTSKSNDREKITKEFDKIFKSVNFTSHEEKRFHKEFLEGLFRRKKIA